MKVKVNMRAIAAVIGACYTGEPETEAKEVCRHVWLANTEADVYPSVVGTDGHRLYRAQVSGAVDKSEKDLCIPMKIARALMKLVDGDWVPDAFVEITYEGEAGNGKVEARIVSVHNYPELTDIRLGADWPHARPVDWRRVIPTEFSAVTEIGFNGEYLDGMAKAARTWRGDDKPVGFRVQIGAQDKPCYVVVNDAQSRVWQAVIMPMRLTLI